MTLTAIFGLLVLGGVAALLDSPLGLEWGSDENLEQDAQDRLKASETKEAFLSAYERSFVGPYFLEGELELANDSGRQLSLVRRARDGLRYLDQLGVGAIVGINGEERSCSDSGSEFLCGEPRPAVTPQAHRKEMAMLAEGYDVLEGTPEMQPENRLAECFILTPDFPDDFNILGSRSVYCFDAETGAIISRVTKRGDRTETFVAQSIKATVGPDDFAPQ